MARLGRIVWADFQQAIGDDGTLLHRPLQGPQGPHVYLLHHRHSPRWRIEGRAPRLPPVLLLAAAVLPSLRIELLILLPVHALAGGAGRAMLLWDTAALRRERCRRRGWGRRLLAARSLVA